MKKGIKAMEKATLVSAHSSLGTDIGRLRGEVRVLQQARQQAVGRAAESLAGGIALVRSVVAGLDADGGDVGRGS